MPEVIDAFPAFLAPDLTAAVPTDGTLGAEQELSPADKLMALAGKTGDFSNAMSLDSLLKLGTKVVEDYERDKADRKDWADTAQEALTLAAQEHKDAEKLRLIRAPPGKGQGTRRGARLSCCGGSWRR